MDTVFNEPTIVTEYVICLKRFFIPVFILLLTIGVMKINTIKRGIPPVLAVVRSDAACSDPISYVPY